MTTVDLKPFTLVFVGGDHFGTDPVAWKISDFRPDANTTWTFMSMSTIERAALRALCAEAIARLDATDAADRP